MKILIIPFCEAERIKSKILDNKTPTISIINHNQKELFPKTDHVLTLQFDDISPKIKYLYDELICFNFANAVQILSFIDKFRDSELIIIHCSAGISRSGAVGKFIHDIFKTDEDSFVKMNPNILPNIWVEHLLYYAYWTFRGK